MMAVSSRATRWPDNSKLKKLLADTMLDNTALKELLAKKW
jgi:hypothetical protein